MSYRGTPWTMYAPPSGERPSPQSLPGFGSAAIRRTPRGKTSPMKVIFLDCDGVLNSWGHDDATGYKGGKDFETITPAVMGHLSAIVEATGAKVVISSTWRKKYTIDEFNTQFKALGFTGEVIGRTPELWQTEAGVRLRRGDEILLWLRTHAEVESFVILDDETDMSRVLGRLVKTDGTQGLTATTAAQAIAMLERALTEHPLPAAATVIVERDGRFAAMRDRDRLFQVSFPGGKIDLGETPPEAAVREAWEETGIEVRAVRSLGIRRANTMVCECFVALEWSGELRPSEEGPVEWATREDLLTGAYPEWSAWALAKYDAFKAGSG